MLKPSKLLPLLRPFQCVATASTTTGRPANAQPREKGFFGSFFEQKVEIQQTAHSEKLSAAKEMLIEVQTHNVRPDCLAKYLSAHKTLVDFFDSHKSDLNTLSVGNFSVSVGDQDQFIHAFNHEGGYPGIDAANRVLKGNAEFQAITAEVLSCLRSRHSQYLLPFSFWPEVYFRSDDHIYELRSYHLRPGTLVEWGNYWARAIRMRDYKHTEAYLGMFSQVGELYNVKHIWCYGSLEERKEAREAVWQKQQSQWSEIVAHTTPLITHMTSRVMEPLDYSPTQ